MLGLGSAKVFKSEEDIFVKEEEEEEEDKNSKGIPISTLTIWPTC